MITGKRILCYTDASDFTDVQGVGNDPIYRRFASVDAVVRRHIHPSMQHFLAEPEYSPSDDHIRWYVSDWGDLGIAPVRLDMLQPDEQAYYGHQLQAIVQHYQSVAQACKGDERDILLHAIKYVNPNFVYLIGDHLVLAIWGMRPDTTAKVGVTDSTIVHEMDYVRTHRVMFDPRPNGKLRNPLMCNMRRRDGSELTRRDIPEIISVDEGYTFAGWEPEPMGHRVEADVTFRARYTSAAPAEPVPPVGPTPPEPPEPHKPEPEPEMAHTVTFIGSEGMLLSQPTQVSVPAGQPIPAAMIPQVFADQGYEFSHWDINPVGLVPEGDLTITALGNKLPPPPPPPLPPLGFWAWCKKGCLARFFIFLALLALLLVLLWLLRDCSHTHHDYAQAIRDDRSGPALVEEPGDFADVPGVAPGGSIGDVPSTPIDPGDLGEGVNPEVGDGGYHAGVFPISPEMPPIDNPEDPEGPQILPNVVSVFFNDDHANLNAFAKDFRRLYPDTERYLLEYDDYVKRVSIMMPADERVAVRNAVRQQLGQKYEFIVVDEIAIAQIDMGSPGSAGGSSRSASPTASPVTTPDSMIWHLSAIGAPTAWRTTRGDRGVVIAVVDDGCDVNHPMLRDNITKPYNVFTQTSSLGVGSGHGTHTAGLACGRLTRRGAVKLGGVAPGCSLMPVQVFQDNAQGTCTSAMISGIAYAIHQGADVVNMSIGPSYRGASALSPQQQMELAQRTGRASEAVWKRVYDMARDKNVVLVFSAGNDNVVSMINPQNRCDSILSVTAIDHNMRKASFSDVGPGSTIAAPGATILSSMPGSSYGEMDGTSMAAPIVAGVAGLLKSLNRDLTPSDIIQIITSTGRTLDQSNIGALVQADRALARVGAPAPQAQASARTR